MHGITGMRLVQTGGSIGRLMMASRITRQSTRHGHEASPSVMRFVKEFYLTITAQGYEEAWRMQAETRVRHQEAFLEKLKLLMAQGTKVS